MTSYFFLIANGQPDLHRTCVGIDIGTDPLSNENVEKLKEIQRLKLEALIIPLCRTMGIIVL